MKSTIGTFCLLGFLAACSTSTGDPSTSAAAVTSPSDRSLQAAAVKSFHDGITSDLDDVRTALVDLQASVPTTHGWDATRDAAALASMRSAWARARGAYERVDGVVGPLFPALDRSLDDRYEGFLSVLAPSGGDTNAFDGDGVTGLQAIERILYSNVTPARVITNETAMPGYAVARFPSTAAEAQRFRSALCAKAISDVTALRTQWQATELDAATAWNGIGRMMDEQLLRAEKMSSTEEESRYSQTGMEDFRQNLAGTQQGYACFSAWLRTKAGGQDADDGMTTGFASLGQTYAAVSGASCPAPPATWSTKEPSVEDLATPFGKLYSGVTTAMDSNASDSMMGQLSAAGSLLGIAR